MHRSLTVSELVSSTLSNNNNDDTETDNEYSREKFITNIGIGLIELLFSSLWLCYGIMFAEYVRNDTVKDGLWATILYSSTFHFTAPWSKSLVGEWYEVNKHQKMIFRFVVFVSTCILFLGVSSSRFTLNYGYGICGGLAHRIVTTQLRFIAMKKFKMDETHLQCNVQPAKAICLLVLPHLQLLLVEHYSSAGSLLIYAAFLLSIVPASLIVRYPRDSGDSGYEAEYPDMSRYRTLSVFSRQMREMEDFSKSPYSTTFTMSHSNTPSMEDEEEITEIEEDALTNYTNSGVDIENEEEQSPKFKPLTHETVQFYYSNMGVNILPDIPEEPETENDLDNSRRNTIDAKRLSRISAALEELSRKENAERVIVRETVITSDYFVRLSAEEDASNHVINENKGIVEPVVATDTLVKLPVVGADDEIKSIEYIHDIHSANSRNLFRRIQYPIRTFCRCSPYNIYVWKQRLRRARDSLADHLFMPLQHSLKDIHFYPTLVSKVTILLNSTIFITLAPHLFLGKNSAYKKVDTTFLLSYMAFSWCLFLVFLPLVVTFSKLKMRYTFSVGLLLIAFSMLLLSKNKMTNDLITWSSLLFGFGFGMVNFSENLVYASFLNERNPNSTEGTLNVMSGFSVILVYYLIYDYDLCELDIVDIFPTVSLYCHVIMAGFWMTVSLIKLCIVRVRKYRK